MTKMIVTVTAFIMMLVLTATVQAGSVLHVDDDAIPNGDGASWNSAFRFLQDALAMAAKGGFIEIRVAQGTYLPDLNEEKPNGTGDRDTSFQLEDNLALVGGYAGIGAADPDERDIDLYETILSGDLLGNDEIGFINNDENSHHVVNSSFVSNTAVIDGFIITAGHAEGNSPQSSGAGMFNGHGYPMVINCTFSTNFARKGGGMYNFSESGPTINNCTFIGNSAEIDGGGMYNRMRSNPTLSNCTFSGNSCQGSGGGMFNFNSFPTISNCAFSGNSAEVAGGGMSNNTVSSPTVTNCTFVANIAFIGGGMANNYICNPTIVNCTFSANSANFWAGGMFNSESSPTIINCQFNGNITETWGGVMYNSESNPTLINCTLSNNEGLVSGGLFNFDSSPLLVNCILFNDTSPEISDNGNSTTIVTYSSVQGGWPGSGNIDANLMFVDPDKGDFHLLPGSPCIDAADNTAVPKGIVADLDDNPRFVDDPSTKDTGNGDPPIVDMGAFEFQIVSCPWDLDNSGSVGTGDLLELFAQWGTPGSADFDGSGTVGTADLLILFANWGPCP